VFPIHLAVGARQQALVMLDTVPLTTAQRALHAVLGPIKILSVILFARYAKKIQLAVVVLQQVLAKLVMALILLLLDAWCVRQEK
jgi:hypothetical protein